MDLDEGQTSLAATHRLFWQSASMPGILLTAIICGSSRAGEVMEPVSVNTIICPACGAELAAAAQECDHCGSATTGGDRRSEAEPPTVSSQQKLIDNPWAIIGLLFGVAAGFGLPFLWKSRGFSTFWKVVLSVIVTLYTILILWLIYRMCIFIWISLSPLWQ
jgi:ribosomal protein L40E